MSFCKPYWLILLLCFLCNTASSQHLLITKREGGDLSIKVDSYNKRFISYKSDKKLWFSEISHVVLLEYDHKRDMRLVKILQRKHIPLEMASFESQDSVKKITSVKAKQTPCQLLLNTAKVIYQSGRLHEVPVLLDGCIKNGLRKTEAVEALRLVILSYIYLEEPERADSAMLTLLRLDHTFTPNSETDPAEFRALYLRYRSWYTFAIGLRFGINSTSAIPVTKDYIVNSGPGIYQPQSGYQFDIHSAINVTKRVELEPYIGYSYSSFAFTNDELLQPYSYGGYGAGSINVDLNLSTITIGAISRYRLSGGDNRRLSKKLTTYVGLGLEASIPLEFTATILSYTDGVIRVDPVRAPPQDFLQFMNPLLWSIKPEFSLKYVLGETMIRLYVDYRLGLANALPNGISNYDVSVMYLSPISGFRLESLSFNLGFEYPLFRPKRIIK